MRGLRSKNKRVRFDGIYIFATIFAGLGGLYLLGTYAASKPIATYDIGTYDMRDYVHEAPGSYRLGLNSEHYYCFSPMNTNSVSIILRDDKGTTLANLSYADGKACFKPQSSFSKVVVNFSPSAQPENLLVK